MRGSPGHPALSPPVQDRLSGLLRANLQIRQGFQRLPLPRDPALWDRFKELVENKPELLYHLLRSYPSSIGRLRELDCRRPPQNDVGVGDRGRWSDQEEEKTHRGL